MSWLELGNIHPLAIDIVFVNVTAINRDTLVSVIGAFVSEMDDDNLKLRGSRLIELKTRMKRKNKRLYTIYVDKIGYV